MKQDRAGRNQGSATGEAPQSINTVAVADRRGSGCRTGVERTNAPDASLGGRRSARRIVLNLGSEGEVMQLMDPRSAARRMRSQATRSSRLPLFAPLACSALVKGDSDCELTIFTLPCAMMLAEPGEPPPEISLVQF